jgi:mannose-6-phosphate isomerase-like protein (cupin superfamily)
VADESDRPGAIIVRPDEVSSEAEPENALVYKKLIEGAVHGPHISLTWIKINGRHRRLVCDASDRVYYILSGKGMFTLGEAAPAKAETGDTVFIPRGTPYAFEGDLTYLVMNGPAFRPGTDRYLE